jgi:hypothetical protein
MSFTMPAELASQLPGKTFLQLGAVMVPLPVGDVALAGGGDGAAGVAVPEPPGAELRVARIEDEPALARAESDRLRNVIADRERRLRSSEQHLHAERARRAEVERVLTKKTRATDNDLRVLREHVAELERELARLGRAVDEAEHLAAAAQARRADAERRLAQQRLLCERAYDAIGRVRGELAWLGGGAPAQRAPPAPAPPGPVQAEKLSAALARLRETTPVASDVPAPDAAPPVAEPQQPRAEPQQPRAEPPARPANPWLGGTFRTLAARDPSSAGRLLLALLPAQRAADPRPIAYDLVLGDLAAARVTVSSAGAKVDLGDTPRPLTEVDFQLVGDLASIARLLAAGPLRRRLGRLAPGGRLARVRGDRERLGALEHLVDARLTLGALRAAGVRIDPVLALTVAGLMIEPAWTAGERFTIAYREPSAPSPHAYLHIRDARAPMVTEEPPHGPVATTIACQPDALLAVLAEDEEALAEISGDQRPLALIRRWLDRAQCG